MRSDDEGDKENFVSKERIFWPNLTLNWKKSFYLRRVTRGVRGWWPASGRGHPPRDQRCTEQEGHWRCLLILCWSFLKPFLKLIENHYTNTSKAHLWKFEVFGGLLANLENLIVVVNLFHNSPNRKLHNSILESRTFFEFFVFIEKGLKCSSVSNHQNLFQNLKFTIGITVTWEGVWNAIERDQEMLNGWSCLEAGCPHQVQYSTALGLDENCTDHSTNSAD